MTDRADYLRRKPATAQAKAAEPNNDNFTRTLWLLVAEDWLRMVPKDEREAEQRFDAAVQTQTTNQASASEQ